MEQKFLARDQFQRLFTALADHGYDIVGPQVKENAIIYDKLTKVEQLPVGVIDSQEPGRYKLKQTETAYCFSWAAPAQSLKPFCFSPRETLWTSSKSSEKNLTFSETLPEIKPLAIVGVKACDLAALALQDQHFLQQEYADPYYAQRRNNLFIVSVDCAQPSNTCFCYSSGDGPSVSEGFDINLTELDSGFLIIAGSTKAAVIMDSLPLSEVSENHQLQKNTQQKLAIDKQMRALPNTEIRETLKNAHDHKHWESIGLRCLACGNCTAVCPSCFCHSEFDESGLGSSEVSHIRQWDSCFNQNHSYIHGIVIRAESASRYRQWMTHKFSGWFEQYGRSGCTGCGRCISWCPVGIDVTEELAILCSGDENA